MNAAKKILLVDDESEILTSTAIWMKAAGFETVTATDGLSAIEAVTQQCPDAIVMDVRMPRMDGLTALATLQLESNTQRIPVVMLSASLVDKDRALDAGATYFLSKPYNGRQLVETVRTAIEEGAMKPALSVSLDVSFQEV